MLKSAYAMASQANIVSVARGWLGLRTLRPCRGCLPAPSAVDLVRACTLQLSRVSPSTQHVWRVDPLSVRIRLALILGVVLLPLLAGTALVLAVAVPNQLSEERTARLQVVAGSVASLQVQSCLGAGDSARLMALAVAKGEPS